MTSLEMLREAELENIAHWFKPGMRVLELGGGNGYQARMIADRGANVVSIDLADRPVPAKTYFPITPYDGKNIPAPDGAFDLVFSSNVLEHIPDLPSTLAEIRRVLQPTGAALHLMPSATWRLWTSATAFVHLAERAVGLRRMPHGSGYLADPSPSPKPGLWQRIGQAFVPHGVYANALVELYYFRRQRWKAMFEKNGFDVVAAEPSGLFYSGYLILPTVSIETRKSLARLLGSSTNLFVTRPKLP